jgi:hypothetical protein
MNSMTIHVLRPGFTAVYINALAAHIIPRRAFASNEQVRNSSRRSKSECARRAGEAHFSADCRRDGAARDHEFR